MLNDYYYDKSGQRIEVDLRSQRYSELPNNSMDLSNSKELIDFPCSDDFLQHYHNLGMTPRKPQISFKEHKGVDYSKENTNELIIALGDEVKSLREKIKALTLLQNKPVMQQPTGQKKFEDKKKLNTEQIY